MIFLALYINYFVRKFTYLLIEQQQVPSITRNNKDASISTKTSAGSFFFSDNAYKIKSYHKQQKTYSSPGMIQQKIDMLQHTENGSNFVFQGISIHFNQL